MPTYNAACVQCKTSEEYLAKISERLKDLPICPKCKKPMTSALIKNEGGFILKGGSGGFYKPGGFK